MAKSFITWFDKDEEHKDKNLNRLQKISHLNRRKSILKLATTEAIELVSDAKANA
jgi:hypothetical protein